MVKIKLKEDEVSGMEEVSGAHFVKVNEMPIKLAKPCCLACASRKIILGGRCDDNCNSPTVLGFSSNKWKFLPRLNNGRKCAGSCWIDNHLIVAGGSYCRPEFGEVSLDSIEILSFDDSSENWNSLQQWEDCESTLPIKVSCHELTILRRKMYLIGGVDDTSIRDYGKNGLNKIWEGSFHNPHNGSSINPHRTFTFKEMPPMRYKRMHHFAITVNDEIHVFGGEEDTISVVEIFNGKQWRLGPRFSLYLSHNNGDHAVLTSNNKILIVTGDKEVLVYNAETETISNVFEIELDDEFNFCAAFIV